MGYDTRDSLKHFRDVTFNPLDRGFCRGNPRLLAILRKKQVTDFHEIFMICRTLHETTGWTVSCLTTLFYAPQIMRGGVSLSEIKKTIE